MDGLRWAIFNRRGREEVCRCQDRLSWLYHVCARADFIAHYIYILYVMQLQQLFLWGQYCPKHALTRKKKACGRRKPGSSIGFLIFGLVDSQYPQFTSCSHTLVMQQCGIVFFFSFFFCFCAFTFAFPL